MNWKIRPETPGDEEAIRQVTADAFAGKAYADGTEAAINDRLREAGALTLSLVAENDGGIIGHAAFSPVTINAETSDWYGLGPISVTPKMQKKGIGSALIRHGIEYLQGRGAKGIALVGDPGYYKRFGFTLDHDLSTPNWPRTHFQILKLAGSAPNGTLRFHPALQG